MNIKDGPSNQQRALSLTGSLMRAGLSYIHRRNQDTTWRRIANKCISRTFT